MSKVIDERVVSMEFDNKHFEKNVQTSMSTLDKLKKSLNLPGASKGLEEVGRAAKRVDMAGLGNAVDTVKVRFSALQVMAVTALSRITNSAITAGKNIAKAFTIDPIKTGLQEYETQIGAVQTILANTQSKGTTLDQVNAALDELNTYADKTIYNFTEMTRNIGTFTAAGTDLETSVNAIQGIANLAAVSGSTSQQASTAMYQLSQALASGTVKLMDWNSVVNAGMGGQVFQDALKETARVHGIAIDEIIEKNGSFRDSLHEEWLTSDILTETLMKFTMATEGLTSAQIEQNKAMLKGMGYSDEQIKGIFELGNTATNAATKVKTFTQLMDTLKEAAQSGWAQTWRLLIGDFEEAKTLWTGVSDTLSEIINKSSERRNKVLGGALTSNWDKLVEKINKAGIETTKFEDTIKSVAKDNGYDVDKLVEKYGSLGDAFKNGAIDTDILKKAVDKLNVSMDKFDPSKVTRELKKGLNGDDVKEVQTALQNLGYGELLGKWGVDGKLGSYTEAAVKAFQEAEGLKVTGIVDEETLNALEKATTKTGDLTENIGDLIDGVDKLGGRDLLIKAFGNVWKAISQPLKVAGSAFREIFGTIKSADVYKFIQSFESFTKKLIPNLDQLKKLRSIFKGVFSVVDIVASVVGGALKFAFDIFGKAVKAVSGPLLTFGARVGDALSKFRDWLKNGDKINEWFKENGKTIKDWFKSFLETPAIKENLDKLKAAFSNLGKVFGGKFEGFGERWSAFVERLKAMDGISLENIKTALVDFRDNVLNPLWKNEDGTTIFDGIINSLKNLWSGVTKFLGPIGEKFANFGDGLGKFVEFIKNNIPAIVAILMGFMVLKTVNKVIDIFRGLFDGFDGIADMLQDVGKSIQKFLNAKAFEARAQGIFTLAKAIALLAGAIALLTFVAVKNPKELAGVFVGLTAIIIALSVLASQVGKMASSVKDTGSLLLVIASISAAILMLAMAAKILGGLDFWSLVQGVAAIGIFLGMIVVVLNSTKKLAPKIKHFDKTFVAFGKMMITLGAALMLFAVATKMFGSMDIGTLAKGVGACIVFLLLMKSMMKASESLNQHVIKFGKTMLALAGAMLLFGIAIKILGNIDSETYMRGLLGLIPFLGIMAIVMASTKLIGQNAASAGKVGVMMIGFATALLLMSASIAMLGHMDSADLMKGMAAVTVLLGVMGLLVASTKLIGANAGDAMKVGVMMLAFSGALLILSGAVYILSGIEASNLKNAVAAISVLGLVFGAMVALTKFAGAGKGVMGTLITLTVAVGVLAASIAVLTMIDDPGKLWNATGAIAALMGMFAILTASTKFVGAKTLGTIIVLTLVVAALSGILYLLSGLPNPDSTIAVVLSLSTLILSLSAACLMLSVVPVAGALSGIASLAILIGGVAIIMAAISGLLALFPDMGDFLNNAIPVLESIGSAIGSFFGNIVGGFASGVTDGLPDIGTNLSTFMTNLKPFLDGVDKIDPSILDAVKTLSLIILSIAGSSLIDAAVSKLTGKSSMTSFVNGLQSLGTAIKTFVDEVGGVSPDDISKMSSIGTAVSAFVEIANKVPKTGGLAQAILGTPDLVSFAEGLSKLGPAISTFSTSTADITDNDLTRISGVGKVIDELSAIANKVPKTGGWAQTIEGVPDLITFANGLSGLGASMVQFNAYTSNITDDDITRIGSIGKVVTEFAKIAGMIPETGGLKAALLGAPDLVSFAESLTPLGIHFAAFGTSIEQLDEGDIEKIKRSAGLIKEFAKIATVVGENSAGWDWWTGKDNLSDFGSNLDALGDGLSKLSSYVSGDDFSIDGINSAITSITDLVKIGEQIGGENFGSLSVLGSEISFLGQGISSFNLSVSTVNADHLSSIASAIKKLASIDTDNANTLQSFIDSLGDVGTDGVTAFTNALDDGASDALSSAANLMDNAIEGVESKSKPLSSAFSDSLDSAVSTIKDHHDDFSTAGGYLVEGFASGITASTFKATAAATAMALAAKLAAEAALGIASPSKEFYKIGGFSGQGLVNALYDYESKVYVAGRDMASYATKGLSKAIAKVSDVINNGMDSQPTIRPVLDLSEVAAGANSIGGMFNMSPSVGVMSNVRTISSMMNRNQNGVNRDVVSAIKDLAGKMNGQTVNNYTVNGVTYDDGSNITNAVGDLIRAVVVEGRV